MNRRLELHELLCETLGSRQVYFQPPVNVSMRYPAIVYSRDDIRNNFADNYVADNLNHYVFTIYY